MPDHQPVDFLHVPNPTPDPTLAPNKPALAKGKFLFVGTLGAMVLGVVLSLALWTSASSDQPVEGFSLFSSFERLVSGGEKKLAGEDSDRVNVLLLGIGGAGHEGPELADTIIFASFKPSTHDVGLISIPRDLTVPFDNYGQPKINAVNAYAERDNPGSGMEATANLVGGLLDEPVNYTVKVDFNGFSEIIDALGGVDVYVDNTFADTTYPIDDGLGNVTTVEFTQGWAHMDGKTALTYSRSRHGTNGEGSDFARARRQQKILVAVKEKVLSLGVLLNPAKLNRIASVITRNVKTDLTLWELVKFAKYIPDIKAENIASHVIDGSSGLVYSTTVNGAYVLLPVQEDWSEFKALADAIFTKNSATSVALVPSTGQAEPEVPRVRVEVQNGTTVTGLASQTAQLLESSGFDVVAIGNAATRDYHKTIIYDLSQGAQSAAIEELKTYLSAEVVMTTAGLLQGKAVPTQIGNTETTKSLVTTTEPIDILIIIGEGTESLVLR